MKAEINILSEKVVLNKLVIPSFDDIKYQFVKKEKMRLVLSQETKTMLVTYLVVGSWVTNVDSVVDGFRTRKTSIGDLAFMLNGKQGMNDYVEYLEKAIPDVLNRIKKKIGVIIDQSEFDVYQDGKNPQLLLLN